MQVKNSQDLTSGNYSFKSIISLKSATFFFFFHVITGTAISEGLVIILFLNFSPSDEAPSGENQGLRT